MGQRGRGRPPHPDVLTPAEWEVLNLLRHGASRQEIGRRRGTSLDAVKYHLQNIASKLGVRGTSALRQWPGIPSTSLLARTRSSHMTASPPNATTDGTTQASGLSLGAIGQVSLSIRDVQRAEGFYRDVLGLRHLFTFGDLVFFDAAGVRIYLHRKGEDEWHAGSILYFVVDEIHPAHAELARRGVRFSGAPHLIYTDDETGAEEWMAFFEDGEGNTLALMSRVTP